MRSADIGVNLSTDYHGLSFIQPLAHSCCVVNWTPLHWEKTHNLSCIGSSWMTSQKSVFRSCRKFCAFMFISKKRTNNSLVSDFTRIFVNTGFYSFSITEWTFQAAQLRQFWVETTSHVVKLASSVTNTCLENVVDLQGVKKLLIERFNVIYITSLSNNIYQVNFYRLKLTILFFWLKNTN